jgi:hypothetical protein
MMGQRSPIDAPCCAGRAGGDHPLPTRKTKRHARQALFNTQLSTSVCKRQFTWAKHAAEARSFGYRAGRTRQ